MDSEPELRASIAAIGCLSPLLVWHGATVDGRRREKICEELGLLAPRKTLHTLEEVCSALWVFHPERAIAFGREHAGGHVGLAPTIRELAALCNVSVSAIALKLDKATPAPKRSPRRQHSQKTEMLRFWCEPQFRHYVAAAGARNGLNLSSTLRVAAWEYVQRNSPLQPTEGTYRSPSPEWFKPPERRGRRVR